MLNAIMLTVVMRRVVKQSAVMLSVLAPFQDKIGLRKRACQQTFGLSISKMFRTETGN
jgi:hypothetical protein